MAEYKKYNEGDYVPIYHRKCNVVECCDCGEQWLLGTKREDECSCSTIKTKMFTTLIDERKYERHN